MADITVYDFNELKNAILDTTSTNIYLGADITFSSGGVIIPRTKGDITIDGNGFTVTDYNSLSLTDVIRFGSVSGVDITFTLKNVKWFGRNYYGIIQAPDSTYGRNITLCFDSIEYVGPQAIHNRQGITKVKDSTFSIERNASVTDPQEFGELNRLIIEGNVDIYSDRIVSGALCSVMWFTSSGSYLEVCENAVLTVNAPQTYMFYIDYNPTTNMYFRTNSKTNITTKNGLFYNASSSLHMANTFIVEENASFVSLQTARNGSVPSFKCANTLQLDSGSYFHLAMTASGTSSLLSFYSLAIITFNNPKSVKLYNNGGNVITFYTGSATTPNILDIRAELLNMWLSAEDYSIAGSFADPPTSSIARQDFQDIQATFSISSSAIVGLTSNIVSGDQGYPLTASSFNLLQAKVLSLGRVNVSLDIIRDISTTIMGQTEQNANLKANISTSEFTGIANEFGEINLAITPFQVGTNVTFGVNWNYLTKYIDSIIKGSVTIHYLSDLVFRTFVAPINSSTIKRLDVNYYIEVLDTRESGDDWYLYATLPNPMKNGNIELDADVKLTQNQSTEIITNTPVLVKQGVWVDGITTITWSELEGFFLGIIPNFPYIGGRYIANMDWELIYN